MFSNNLKFIAAIVFTLLLLSLRFFQVFSQEKFAGKEVKLIGKIQSEPVNFGQSQYFQIQNYRVRTKIFPKFHFGDLVEIVGTPNENLLIPYPNIKKLGESKNLISQILEFRRFLISQSLKIWPQPEASLLTGVILGQDTISANFRKILINTGTIHIVVVSGQNVAMLAGFITGVFGKIFQRKTTSILVLTAIIFYTILTGFQPPTVRAAVMGILAFLAKLTGRENWGFWALGVAALTMLFFDPNLIFSISFQLSFAATFGILFAEPVLAEIFKNFPRLTKESLSVTLSAWIFTAPLIIFYFAQFTPITPFSNLLVLPVVPFLMISGAVSLAVSIFSLFLGQIFAVPSFVTAFYFTFITEILAKIPYAAFKLPQFNLATLASSYIFVVLAVLWGRKKFLAID